MQQHLVAHYETRKDLRKPAVRMPDLHRRQTRPAIAHHKSFPLVSLAKQSACGRNQHIIRMPHRHAHLDAKAVAQGLCLAVRRLQIDQHNHPLLFDTQGRDLGECCRFDTPHSAFQGIHPTPLLDQHLVARFNSHCIARQNFRLYFNVRRIAYFNDRLTRIHHRFTLLHHGQHLAGDR